MKIDDCHTSQNCILLIQNDKMIVVVVVVFFRSELKDTCTSLSAPQFGDIHCTRSRHASQSFYRTRCSLWCNKGYVLLGPSVKFCNGSDGIWDPTETTCSREYTIYFDYLSTG